MILLRKGRPAREIGAGLVASRLLAAAALPPFAFLLGALVSTPVPRVEAASMVRLHGEPDRMLVLDDEGDEPAIARIEEAAEPAPISGDAGVPSLVTRARRPPLAGPHVLRLRALADGDTVEVVPFDREGAASPDAFAAIEHVMRFRRTGARREVHPRLVEVLRRISSHWDDRYVRLLSGYREAGHGTSQTSYHTRGMAADIKVRGVPVEEVYRVATEVGAFGVGIYPHDGFVHVDVRDIPHRWEQVEDGGENLPREHPARWRMARSFEDLLEIR